MKKILFIISFLILPLFVFAETSNVGIIKGIWFSHTQLFSGKTLRIYTAVQNNSGFDVDGTIEFFDNEKSLGKKDFSALNGRIVESWMDTVLEPGEHKFSVLIKKVQKNIPGEKETLLEAETVSSERVRVVKIDTDGDNIPDDIDTDDDGDGISDIDEIAAGSDPLDSESVPIVEEENSDNSLATLIDNILNTDSSPNTNNKTNENIAKTENNLLEQSPELAQKIAEQNKVMKSLVLEVSKLQNFAKNIVKKEQEKFKNAKNKKNKITLKSSQLNSKKTIEEKSSLSHKSGLKDILTLVYGKVLAILSWLFSLWWFVVILLFLGIYLFLKLLFKIFGKKRD